MVLLKKLGLAERQETRESDIDHHAAVTEERGRIHYEKVMPAFKNDTKISENITLKVARLEKTVLLHRFPHIS